MDYVIGDEESWERVEVENRVDSDHAPIIICEK